MKHLAVARVESMATKTLQIGVACTACSWTGRRVEVGLGACPACGGVVRARAADPAPGTTVHEIPVFVDGRLLGFDGEPSPEERALLEERERLGDYT